MKTQWVPIEFDYKEIKKHRQKISEIIDGTKPAVIIRNFYEPNLCKLIIKNSRRFLNLKQNDRIHKKIGASLISFLNKKSDYFQNADSNRKILHEIFEKIEDPRRKIHHLLSELMPNRDVRIAFEGNRKYACGVIRFHEIGDSAPIHRDCVKFEAPNFMVAGFMTQLSTVLYLQQTEKGGELVIYNQIWKRDDEKFREIDFGYSGKVLEKGAKSVKIKPNQGDLIIINPTYFHEILPVWGKKKRITLGLFLAFSKYGNQVVTWS